MNYGELTKTYSKFKIPVEKYADYYIDTLIEAGIVDKRPIELLKALTEKVGSVSSYKGQKMDEILEYFKKMDWNLNNIDYSKLCMNCTYTLLDFNNFKSDKFYISIDLKEANWQAWKEIFSLKFGSWKEWTEKTFELDPYLSESKNFRQYIFGNTNPKRIQKVQELMMQNVIEAMPNEIKGHIVSRKSDELILEFNYNPIVHWFHLNYIEKIVNYELNLTMFKIEYILNFGETVKLKHSYTSPNAKEFKTKLTEVNGNRFFIHLKSIILNKPILEKDLFFEVNKKLAQWVI